MISAFDYQDCKIMVIKDDEKPAPSNTWNPYLESTVLSVQVGSISGRAWELCEFSTQVPSVDGASYSRYQTHFPLVCSMLEGETKRRSHFEREGRVQLHYPKSRDAWWKTLTVLRGRALDWVTGLWLLVVAHATLYTIVQEVLLKYRFSEQMTSGDMFFMSALNSTLGFLLIFRLNRAATRWWVCRSQWGRMTARMRSFVDGVLAHGRDPVHRDNVIRWALSYAISTKEFLRGTRVLDTDAFSGILNDEQILCLQGNTHPPLYAISEARYHLEKLFHVDANTSLSVAHSRTQQLVALEAQLNVALDCCGAMERIKATPLPIVYVAHLRTFLLLTLLALPYVWGPHWRYATIPIVTIVAFAFLGIEAAAIEVECPFSKDRPNALNMDGYCLGMLDNIQQLILNDADRHLSSTSTSQRSC